MPVLHLDYETCSPVDIKRGAYRYAQEGRILIACIAVDNSDPMVWDCVNKQQDAAGIFWLAIKEGWPIYAHNATFERAISLHCLQRDMGLPPPSREQWYCTQAMAMRAALPASLDKLAKALQLPGSLQKDTRGKELIRLFNKHTPQEKPGEFEEFKMYCAQDVRVEQEVYKRLKAFDIREDIPLVRKTWELDKRINDRGVPIDMAAVQEAVRIVERFERKQTKVFRELTGLNPTQTGALLQWCKEKGYPADNLQGAAIKEVLAVGGLGDTLAQALRIKEELSFAATKKLKTMQDCADLRDNRVRGTLRYHGAGPGRWSGTLIQPQNFKRPTIPDTPLVLKMLQHGQGDHIETLWGNPVEAISSSVRHFIALPGNIPFCDGDYSAIEARIVCWVADEMDAVREFEKGIDRYRRMGARIFGVPEHRVNGEQRWFGKQFILGCGYQMGPDRAFSQVTDAAKAQGRTIRITEALCASSVVLWRETHSRVVDFWYAVERSFRRALLEPNKRHPVGRHIGIEYGKDPLNGISFVSIYLPSGRRIVYPAPQVDGDTGELTYWGQLKPSQKWGRVHLYGGKITENICQGVAADLMAHGASNAEERGFPVFSLIHDQALAENPTGAPIEDFIAALVDKPEWAEGLPLQAEGSLVPFYSKS